MPAETRFENLPQVKIVNENLLDGYHVTLDENAIVANLHHPEVKNPKDVEIIISDDPRLQWWTQLKQKLNPNRDYNFADPGFIEVKRGKTPKIYFFPNLVNEMCREYDNEELTPANNLQLRIERGLNRLVVQYAYLEDYGENNTGPNHSEYLWGAGKIFLAGFIIATTVNALTEQLSERGTFLRSIGRLASLGIKIGAAKLVSNELDKFWMAKEMDHYALVRHADNQTLLRTESFDQDNPPLTLFKDWEDKDAVV